jgi:hypothetical protein
MKKTIIFLVLSLFILGNELSYKGHFNGNKGIIKVNNKDIDNKKIYTLEVEGYLEYFELDINYETLYWELIYPKENTYIKCRNMKEYLQLEGTYKDKNINKKINLDGYKWVQLLPYGLKDGDKFKIIASTGSKAMSCGTMTVKNMGQEVIEVEGQKYKTELLNISLNGIFSLLWKGKYWYIANEKLLVKLNDEYSSMELYNLK